VQGYYYELIKLNAQCPRRSSIKSGITLPECFRLAESKQGNNCAERLVEWGNSGPFEPNGVGKCHCFSDKCTEEQMYYEYGEHMVKFIPESFMNTTTTTTLATLAPPSGTITVLKPNG